MVETYMDIIDWKKPAWKGYILYDLNKYDILEKAKIVEQ